MIFSYIFLFIFIFHNFKGNNQEALQVRQDAHANNPASYHNAKRGFQLDTHSKEPWQYFPLKSLNQKHIYNNYQPVLNDERRSNGAERNKNDLQVIKVFLLNYCLLILLYLYYIALSF